MADVEPYRIVVLMDQQRAASLESGFQQPSGVADRRPISEQVTKNIVTIAPRCFKQGIINHEALSYLVSWSQGDWPRLKRPSFYAHLGHRCELPFRSNPEAPSWAPPNRLKHLDLSWEGIPQEDSDDDVDEGDVRLGVLANER